MKKYKACSFCEGTGRIDHQKESCYLCLGKGNLEVEITNDKDIRMKCNQIQELLDGTDICIPDKELIKFLNNYKI